MKRYKAILFDLDGTLVDTSPGIRNSFKHTFLTLNMSPPTEEQMEGIIGAPLKATFMDRFSMSETDAFGAVEIFRSHYAMSGVFEAIVYDEIFNLLQGLKSKKCLLGVATLKPEVLARKMLIHLGLFDCFDFIAGSDPFGSMTKTDLLKICMKHFESVPYDTLLIGDSEYDSAGAAEIGMDFGAVLYGYGFCNCNAVQGAVFVAENTDELKKQCL